MGLEALAAAVRAELVAAHPTLSDDAKYRVTTRPLEHSYPPRVIWRPATDAFAAPFKSGPPRALATCVVSVAIEVWGVTIAQVEDLRERLVRALYPHGNAAVKFTGGQWGPPPGDGDLGEPYTLRITVEFAQRDGPVTLATPTSAALSPSPTASTGDGALDTGEP